MSRLNIRNAGAWVDPANISVYNSGTSSWTPVEKVYYRDAGSWVEVWPLTATITADFAIITISVDNTKYPDLNWEVRAQNPAYMQVQTTYGGKLVEDLDSTAANVNYIWTSNPRDIWLPEEPYNFPFITRLGRDEQSAFSYSSYHYGTYDPNLLLDERMGILADAPTIAQRQAGYNQVCLHYDNLYSNFFTNGYFDFNDATSLGELFRFSFQAAWPAAWPYNPASYPITFTIDVYQGGTIVRDPVTKVYSGSGFTQKLTYTQVYQADKFDIAGPGYSLPSDHTAFYLDYDFQFGQVTIGQPTPPAVTNTLPRLIEIRTTAVEPYLKPVVWITNPLYSPTQGIGYPALDNPVYESNQITVDRYSIYPLRSPATGSTEVPGTLPGMGQVAAETMQQYGRYGDWTSETYPFRPLLGSSTRWWMTGYFDNVIVSDPPQYIYFDPVQYRWDNPTVDSVTLRIQAWYPTGYGPATETFFVYGWPNPTKGTEAQNTAEGTGGTIYGSFTKNITAVFPDSDPRFGTNVGTITINFLTNTVTLTPL